ncbi:MAG: hypothetical protein IK130_02375 [Oscillospiraceae bacterium]|nr:hypothetical protein [Oscillospiraceae bacterium]
MKTQLIKRMISAVCAGMMLAGGAATLPVQAAETQKARIMGDMNGDCKVDMKDAKAALDIAVAGRIGLVDKTANKENNSADIDMNGQITSQDALSILQYYCKTLVGEQPLWADIRKVSYHEGSDFDPEFNLFGEKDTDLPFEKRSMYLEIGCAEGKPGETVSVQVYIAGVAGITGFQYFQSAPEALKRTDIRSVFGTGRDDEAPEFQEYSGVANVENGGMVWAAAYAHNLDVKEGMVIATYYYTIPENAKEGDLFILTTDGNEKSMFVVDTPDNSIGEYSYTVLDGVVAVK